MTAIWAEEPGIQLRADKRPDGSVVLTILEVDDAGTTQHAVKASATLSAYRTRALLNVLKHGDL